MFPRMLRHFFMASLQRQLVAGMVLVVASMMTFLVWNQARLQTEAMVGLESKDAAALARSIAAVAAPWVASRDYSGLQEIVDGIEQYPDLQYALVVDLQGQVIAHSDVTRVGLYLTDFPSIVEPRFLRQDASIVDTVSPIAIAGQHIGWARVGLGQQSAVQEMKAARLEAITSILVSIALAALVAMLAVRRLTHRISAIQTVADAVEAGHYDRRVAIDGVDEAARLARHFNLMLDSQSRGRNDLEAANAALSIEIAQRKQGERRIRSQLEHLRLLDEITRSAGERHNLDSIFRVVLRNLEEELPIDFGAVLLFDEATESLQVSCIGPKSDQVASELRLLPGAAVGVDNNGLSRCVRGDLVYEPDVGALEYPFPSLLASGELGGLVLAPLKSESRVFGLIVAARRETESFSSIECEFLRQLSEHVALAARQAQLYDALKEAYEDLRQTQATMMQEERLRALGQMASGIAHDINNALSPVSLYTESLLETEQSLSERGREYLEVIGRAVEDVSETVARLREFYRQREEQLELTPVTLNDLAKQVLDLTKARWSDMAQSRGVTIQIVTELEPSLPKVMGVESEIREALTNLIINGVDAMPDGGSLTLRTRVAPANMSESVVVEVSDTGVGMDDETRRRCLEPFFTTKGERGTGLGLAMVFGVVKRHSCDFEIDSAPGKGTTMRLIFTAIQSTPLMPVSAKVVTQVSRLRLLIVDDDPMLLKSLRDTLEMDGHSVVSASGGEDGITAFRDAIENRKRFDVVFTDLGMPHVDGRRVAQAVKSLSPSTPVIMLTGWGRRLQAEGEIPPHVDRMLAKPPKLNEIRQALAELRQPELRTGS